MEIMGATCRLWVLGTQPSVIWRQPWYYRVLTYQPWKDGRLCWPSSTRRKRDLEVGTPGRIEPRSLVCQHNGLPTMLQLCNGKDINHLAKRLVQKSFLTYHMFPASVAKKVELNHASSLRSELLNGGWYANLRF